MVDIKDYLQKKHIPYKIEKGSELRLSACPFCTGKYDCTVNIETSRFICFKCRESGSFYRIVKHLGDLDDVGSQVNDEKIEGQKKFVNVEELTDKAHYYHKKLFTPRYSGILEKIKEAMDISTGTMRKLLIGVRSTTEGEWITIPHITNDYVVNIKFRSLWPLLKYHFSIPNAETILYNQDVLQGRQSTLITEGEKDTIRLIHAGFAAVGLTTGAGSKLTEKQLKKLEHIKTIYLALDNDLAGAHGIEVIASQLGYERCKVISVAPHKDVLEFFTNEKNAFEKFKIRIRRAKKLTQQSVIPMSMAIKQALRKKVVEGDALAYTPWDSVNRLVKGWNPQEVVVVSAPRKTGKTSFCTQVALWNAAKARVPSLIYCKEMPSFRIAKRIVQAVRDVDEEDTDPLDYIEAASTLNTVPIYIGKNIAKKSFEQDAGIIKAAVSEYGIRIVIYDNLHFLARSKIHREEEISSLMKSFKMLAEDLDIVLILIVQPRKLYSTSKIMTSDDMKWSGSIGDDADQVIVMHRNKEKYNERGGMRDNTLTLIRVTDSRYSEEGQVFIEFDPSRCVFSETDETRATGVKSKKKKRRFI